MTLISSMPRTAAIGALAVCGLLVFAVSASSHTANGGNGNDFLEGHDHVDNLSGGPGNDRVFGRGSSDDLFGGTSCCDVARGNHGLADDVCVADDGAGGDEAYGGRGGFDECWATLGDFADFGSCEAVHPTSCSR